jgi:hypothetical protein
MVSHLFIVRFHFISIYKVDSIYIFNHFGKIGAASKGNTKIVDLLLSRFKSNINTTDCEGNSAL